jgi:type II secretory pathway pseudopilin PulG
MIERFHRSLRDDSGVTLAELIVVIGLLTVVLGFTMQGFLSVQTATTTGGLRLENLEQARLLMDNVTKDVRTAVRLGSTDSPFLIADDNDVTFYGNLNLTTQCPKKIRLYVDAQTRLIEQVTEPNAGGVPPSCSYTGTPTNRFVGRFIANDGSEPIFTYYYDDGDEDVAFTAAQTPLSAANRLLVNGVGIRLSIRKPTNYPVADTTLINKVRLPNVDYNPIATPSP